MKSIKVIGFDADDTLWSNAVYFKEAEQVFQRLLMPYVSIDTLKTELYATESKNMEWYGYGAMAFTLSMIETAIRVTGGAVSADIIADIMQAGRSILEKPIELFPGVREVLPQLQHQYRLVVVTKGDLLDQERKLNNSGLVPYFQHIEVVSEKHEANYEQLVQFMGIQPAEFLMVGNSLKSDVIPVLSIGGHAVHVPYEMEWVHEMAEKPQKPYQEIPTLFHLPEILGALL